MESPWGIDKQNEQFAKLTKEQLKQAQAKYAHFAQCFATDAGQKVLADLEKELHTRPTWDPKKGHEWGFYYEGQNDVLRFIINRVNIVRKND